MPERIYINPNPEHRTWLIGKGDISFIEYVKEDAFIEKALKWIDFTFHGASIDGFGGESVDVVMSDASVYKDDLLENFKRYMKGE